MRIDDLLKTNPNLQWGIKVLIAGCTGTTGLQALADWDELRKKEPEEAPEPPKSRLLPDFTLDALQEAKRFLMAYRLNTPTYSEPAWQAVCKALEKYEEPGETDTMELSEWIVAAVGWGVLSAEVCRRIEALIAKREKKAQGNAKNVREILAAYLQNNGFDGLCGEKCGCSGGNLAPCNGNIMKCEPAYREKCIGKECPNPCDVYNISIGYEHLDCYSTTRRPVTLEPQSGAAAGEQK